ncbi:sensor histidine kinase [Maridesulfovibrio sp. FT414]|uniref:sensor histidine kinase n=1 Tax=Maridesulfovibrio sp. FT414 TaxID=2979469 RepID=UPI003D805E0D
MENLPSLKRFGEKLDLLKQLVTDGNSEQADSLAQTIFEDYALSRDNCLHQEDTLIDTRNSLCDITERAEQLEHRLKETLSAYNSNIRTFRKFCTTQQYMNSLKSIAELPELLQNIAVELDVFKVSVVLDRELCSGIPVGETPTLHMKGCMRYIDATLSSSKNRIFIGPISKMMRPDIFFGDQDMSPAIDGSCFAFGLMDKYSPDTLIGLFSIYDPSTDRYHPEMGTDFLEHFSSSLASTIINVISHQRAALLRQDVDRITRHDLKTPLNAVINLPQILLSSENDPGRAELIKTIQDAGYRMLGLINRSYDIYRMESGNYILKPDQVDLLRLTGKIRLDLLGMIESKKIQFKVTVNGQPPSGGHTFLVKGEELLLFSMLANLVKNSIEAAPQNSEVCIDFADGNGIRIKIHNPGEVHQAIRDRFFDKYVTYGKKGGTGLGTYSAMLIAKAHGGDIHMESTAEEGTSILIFI